MARISLEHVTKHYGSYVAVDDFSLDISDGELIAVLGPSGCGKTTTLRMIAGFVEPSGGGIHIGGRDVTRLPAHQRNTGMVFQGYALFPHMSVQQNVAFGLQMRKVPAAERERQVDQALQLVRLQELGKRMPRELSGGQQQRVALARALVVKPDALLLDEPLSNLDAKLRTEVRIEIRQLQQRLGLTAVFVTHDQEEALTIADRLVVMSNGVIQQVGTPEELYERPRNRFVADFIGKSNFFTGTIETPSCFRTTTGVRIAFGPNGAPSHGEVVLAVRPEKIAVVGEAPASAPNAFPARVELVTYLGARSEYLLRLETGEQLIVHTQNTRDESRRFAAAGAPCHVVWDPLDSLILAPISSAQAEDSHAS